MSSNQFHSLRVADKIEETKDSTSFIFDIPSEFKEVYAYEAGQYITLKLIIDGQEERRAYSIFTAPHENKLGVTVKRVSGGKVSNYLIDNVYVDDKIEVMPPEGKFIVRAGDQRRDHFFITAGSGITPIMSMVKTVLEKEPQSTVYVLYGNRHDDSIIFKNAFEHLKETYTNQIYLTHILSQPSKEKASGLKGLFGKKVSKWSGWTGRIDNSKLQLFLDEHENRTSDVHYYLCGPGGMIETAESFLKGKGIESQAIHKEYFTTPDQEKAKTQSQGNGTEATMTIILNGETFETSVPSDKTVLEVLLDMGKDAPYSCTSGACSTCVAKVTNGEVKMDACFALDDDEIKDGLVLTCQSRPVSKTATVNFDA